MVSQEQHGGGAAGAARGADAADEDAAGAEGVEATLKKREYVLRELYDTEEIYVSDLRLVCEGYMKHMMVRYVPNVTTCKYFTLKIFTK